MQIRNANLKDADNFIDLQLRLDRETEFMMYEPGERNPDRDRTENLLKSAAEGENLLLVVEDKEKLWGYLWAERGSLNRIRHSAYIVTGICKDYRGLGIGTAFFRELDKWAVSNQIKRLELTVMCTNEAAMRLYEKSGFVKEGIKKNSMLVNGQLTDEYYMAKLY
ncbi:GNAT family N-acetyltransferase [Anaerocolumna xylanovorans]|uniref:Protein N-acetyltransferase, RimJ/RimL family n=1 Tax=Anaerocolumna xylanovorans DSM 12503 TaxID=1121345 RepID=A0A1M7Y269_9FIRM|nr:GNAT family N-acetyltransferase [Anaerocolumna xylanovorans]SHO45952.1 Protein N-acetyltransferase, RimJ/RimL family [Anaerocolumna xylanovorans DSM 12503]